MGTLCGKTKKHIEPLSNTYKQPPTHKKVSGSSKVENETIELKYSYSNKKDVEKTNTNPIILRETIADAAEARIEKNKNKGISTPGKLSFQLAMEKKKTHSKLLEEIAREKQAEKDQRQKEDLQVLICKYYTY